MTKKDGIKHLQCTLLDMNDMKEYINYDEFAGLVWAIRTCTALHYLCLIWDCLKIRLHLDCMSELQTPQQKLLAQQIPAKQGSKSHLRSSISPPANIIRQKRALGNNIRSFVLNMQAS